jgi:hypothetical protein
MKYFQTKEFSMKILMGCIFGMFIGQAQATNTILEPRERMLFETISRQIVLIKLEQEKITEQFRKIDELSGFGQVQKPKKDEKRAKPYVKKSSKISSVTELNIQWGKLADRALNLKDWLQTYESLFYNHPRSNQAIEDNSPKDGDEDKSEIVFGPKVPPQKVGKGKK